VTGSLRDTSTLTNRGILSCHVYAVACTCPSDSRRRSQDGGSLQWHDRWLATQFQAKMN